MSAAQSTRAGDGNFPAGWQERQTVAPGKFGSWYETRSRPLSQPREVVADGITYQFRPVYAEAPASARLAALVLELAEAVDNAAEDIGGSRPQLTILREAVQVASDLAPSAHQAASANLETENKALQAQVAALSREAWEWSKALEAQIKAAAAEPALHSFKNFHRLLCERFDYCHDEKDWRRDQLSLIEFIANKFPSPVTGDQL